MRSPDDEREQRMKLSAVYRIFARLGMDDLIYTHISARIPGSKAHFLLNPFGLMSEEVTASNLVKVDLEGNKVTLGHPYDINHAGYAIHSALHEALPNAYCVMNGDINTWLYQIAVRLMIFSQLTMFLQMPPMRLQRL